MHRRRRGERPGAPVLWRKPRDVDAPPRPRRADLWRVLLTNQHRGPVDAGGLLPAQPRPQPQQVTRSRMLTAGQGARLLNMNQERGALMRCCPLTDIAPGNQEGRNTVIKESRLTGRWRESQKQCRQPPGGWSPGPGPLHVSAATSTLKGFSTISLDLILFLEAQPRVPPSRWVDTTPLLLPALA